MKTLWIVSLSLLLITSCSSWTKQDANITGTWTQGIQSNTVETDDPLKEEKKESWFWKKEKKEGNSISILDWEAETIWNRLSGKKTNIPAWGAVLSISPDEKWAIYIMSSKEQKVSISSTEESTYLNKTLWIISLEDGSTTELFRPLYNRDQPFTSRINWSEDSLSFAAGCSVDAPANACHVSLTSGKPVVKHFSGLTNISREPPERLVSVTLSPDGQTIAWLEWRHKWLEKSEITIKSATIDKDGTTKESSAKYEYTRQNKDQDDYFWRTGVTTMLDMIWFSPDATTLSVFRTIPYKEWSIGKYKLAKYTLERSSGKIVESDVSGVEANDLYLGHNVVSSSDGRYTILPVFVRTDEEVKDKNYFMKAEKNSRWYLIDVSGNIKSLTDAVKTGSEADIFIEPYWFSGNTFVFPYFDISTETSNGVVEYAIDTETGEKKEICATHCERLKAKK